MSDRAELLAAIKAKAVIRGDFVLSSGQRSDWYVDLRKVLLDGRLAPLAGRVMLDLTWDLGYQAAGGLTMGADPVATAMMHAAASRGTPIDAFVVRKKEKDHGTQRRIEGPDMTGRRVLVVEDTSTTGASPLTAVEALREAGAEVVGVAVLVNRGAREHVTSHGLAFRAAYDLSDLGVLRACLSDLCSRRSALCSRRWTSRLFQAAMRASELAPLSWPSPFSDNSMTTATTTPSWKRRLRST